MSNNDWKSRLNVVYSTNPDFQYEHCRPHGKTCGFGSTASSGQANR